jgi:ATPase family associated with various cellular activities (AAA)
MLEERAQQELQEAVEALEALVSMRLEERGVVVAGPPGARLRGLVQRPLGLAGSDNLPRARTFEGDGPLARLVSAYDLTVREAVTVVAALAPELDEKFDVLYGQLSDRGDAPGLTGEVLRTLLGRTFEGRLRVPDLLAPGAKLRGLRLLDLEPAPASHLAGRVRLNPELAAWLLGRSGQEPEFSPEFPARRLQTVHGFDDLVLEPALKQRLRGVLDRIRLREEVLTEWGLGAHHDNAAGFHVLLHGPPGTGKTMAAAVLGREAGLPVYRIDMALLVSKWVGDTSKNMARVFDRAEARGWILFVDECDALLGRRGEITEAKDRWAAQEVSFLLTRLETFDGVSLLATNLVRNVDEAFLRRVHAQLEFTEPGESERAALWRAVRPRKLPLAEDVDLDELASRFPMTGAEIRNAMFDAAYRARADGVAVGPEHLDAAIRAEHEKSGRIFPMPVEAPA